MNEELCIYFFNGCKERKSLVCLYREDYIKCDAYYEMQRRGLELKAENGTERGTENQERNRR